MVASLGYVLGASFISYGVQGVQDSSAGTLPVLHGRRARRRSGSSGGEVDPVEDSLKSL
jgi:hypothetical protein